MNTDEWWRAKHLFDGFNTACKNVAASFLKVGDELMSAITIFPPIRYQVSHSLGENGSEEFGHKYLSWRNT